MELPKLNRTGTSEYITVARPVRACSSMRSQKQYIGYLDGIRGLAAFWVVLAHCMILGGWYWPHFPDPNAAVDIFMILSGYLMAYHARGRGGEGRTCFPAGVGGFYIRRFFRIAPVFYFMLILSFALSGPIETGLAVLQNASSPLSGASHQPFHAEATPMNLAMHFSFLFGLFPRYASSTYLPDWSIGLEVQFYAVFPLLLLGLRRYRYLVPVLALTALSFFVTRLLNQWPSPVPGATSFYPHPSFLLLKLPLFLAGMLIADAIAIFHEDGRKWPVLLAVLAVGLAACHSPWVVATTLLLLFLGAIDPENKTPLSRGANFASRILGCRFARFLAATSYVVYLAHGCCIGLWGCLLAENARFLSLSPMWRVFVLCFLVTISAYLFATVLHYLIELPGIALGRRLEGKRAATAT